MRLADADSAARPDRPQFLFAKAGAGSQTVSHSGLPGGEIACQEADILELEEAGYLRFHSTRRGIVFDVTLEGRRRAGQLELTTKASAGGVVDQHALDWSTRVLPVLQAVARSYSRAPSQAGVRTEDVVGELGAEAHPSSTALVLEELVRAGYLEETMGGDQLPGPAWSRLTEKGLQVTAGWPSGAESPTEALFAALKEGIDAAESPEERNRLQRAYDALSGLSRDVLSEVLAKVISGQL